VTTESVRPLRADESSLLRTATLGNVNWADERLGMRDVLERPELAHYTRIEPARGDFGVVAERSGVAVGVAWAVFLPGADPGYGFVDEQTPELSLWVAERVRGQGAGRRLLRALLGEARARGVPGVSLSVEHGNAVAAGLYRAEGFRPVPGRERDGVMLWSGGLRPESRLRVERHWSRVFGRDVADGEDRVVVSHAAPVRGYAGILVVVRQGSTLVSAPPALVEEVAAWPWADGAAVDPRWWAARRPGWAVLGPSVHSFLDDDRALPRGPRARRCTVDEVRQAMGARVTEEEWDEAGFGDEVETAWILDDADGRPVAAANLTPFDPGPADVGVLVGRDARGRGYAVLAGAVAARAAVAACGIARWRARTSNIASRRTASRLGFVDDCIQLAVRP
jgi:RimJ/RimL family protein N-acetyltransferase